jgi:tetratricopeptide (TPR) repeat protein
MPAAAKVPDKTPPNFTMWVCLFLVLSTLAVYWPVTHYDFVAYDDTDFVTANPHVQAGLTAEGFKWAWTSEVARNWHPVTLFTHMLDCQLFGLRAGWHHFTNLAIHILNAVLLFLVLKKMTAALWRSAAVAAFFALHPLHVESVAWIAERKDVLSTLFLLLTLWAYCDFAVEDKTSGNSKRAWMFYGLSLLLFALGLMSKPMLVTLPFALLLLDFWPLGRFKWNAPAANQTKGKGAKPAAVLEAACRRTFGRLALEKVPFLALAAVDSWITFAIQQHGGAMLTVSNWPIASRLQNALVSYVRYIGKMFWPENLAALYLKHGEWPLWMVAGAALLLVAITIAAVVQVRRRPWFAVGWFWYLGTLVPVIGVVQVGMQTMADRYTYVPLIGIFIILVWGTFEIASSSRLPRVVPAIAAVAALAACMGVTAKQVTYWRDSEALFRRMIDATDGNFMAHYNLGNFYSRHDQMENAIAQYRMAIEEEGNYADAHNNLGGVLLDQKKYDEALSHYTEALRIRPDYIQYFNLANAQADAASARNDAALFAKAVENYQQALKLKPDSADIYNNLGMTLAAAGRPGDAATQFRAALQYNPGLNAARTNLAFALVAAGQHGEAIKEYAHLEGADPSAAQTHYQFASALVAHGKTEEGISEFRAAIALKPELEAAQLDLANVLSRSGKLDEAIAAYNAASRLNPNRPETFNGLGVCYAMQGKMEPAAEQFRKVTRLKPDDAGAWGNLGNALAAQNKLDEALPCYLEALKRNPNDFQTEFNFGLTLAREGKKSEAESHYRAALRINPNYSEAQRALQELNR